MGFRETVIERLNSVVSLLSDIRENERRQTYPWNLSATVPASTPIGNPVEVVRTIDKEDPVIRHFQCVSTPSAQQAVGVRMELSTGEVLVPRDPDGDSQYAPLDNVPIEVEMNTQISSDQEVIMKYVNNDGTNDHFAKTILRIAEGS